MTDRPALFDEPTQPLARSWREAFARLSATSPPCPGFNSQRWQDVHSACLRFLSDNADEAAAKGWTAEELFGVHPTMGAVRVDGCGALMVSGGKPVTAVHADRIAFEQGSFYRAPGAPKGVPVWAWREAR
jgi:hypothetical protein